MGLFLGWQNPVAVKGVSVEELLRAAVMECRSRLCGGKNKDCLTMKEFGRWLRRSSRRLKIKEAFLRRSINDGFSGGEKKKLEILQMSILKPKLAVLDEMDSGLDVDALKLVAGEIMKMRRENPQMAIFLITHYQ